MPAKQGNCFFEVSQPKGMYNIEKTIEFDKWLKKLKDLTGKAKIIIRIQKIEKEGHFGDCKQVSEGIRELGINHANGIGFTLQNINLKLFFYY